MFTLKPAVDSTSRRGIGGELEHRVLGRVIVDGRVRVRREILQVPAVLVHADGDEQARGHGHPDLVRVLALVPDHHLERHARHRRKVPLKLDALERQVLARGEHYRVARRLRPWAREIFQAKPGATAVASGSRGLTGRAVRAF